MIAALTILVNTSDSFCVTTGSDRANGGVVYLNASTADRRCGAYGRSVGLPGSPGVRPVATGAPMASVSALTTAMCPPWSDSVPAANIGSTFTFTGRPTSPAWNDRRVVTVNW